MFFKGAKFSKILKNSQENLFLTADMAYLNWNDKNKNKEDNLVIISIKLCYICLIFLALSCFRVKMDIFKVSGTLIFQKSQKITRKFVSYLQI